MRPKLMDWEGERVPKINEIWMLACIKNSLKNRWFWKPKLEKILKKTLPKTMYFSHAFFNGFSKGLGRVLGSVWDLLGVSWGTLKPLFLRLCCQEGPRGPKRWPRGLLGPIWDGFGEVLGRVWEAKMNNKIWTNRYFWYFFWYAFRDLILVEFCLIFDNFDGGW